MSGEATRLEGNRPSRAHSPDVPGAPADGCPVDKRICNTLWITCIIVFVILVICICVGFIIVYENENQLSSTVDVERVHLPPEQSIWYNRALRELESSLNRRPNVKRAKNVVLFVAPDLPPEAGRFVWETFPHASLLRIGPHGFQPTALFGGVHTAPGVIGVDATVRVGDCEAERDPLHHVSSMLQWAHRIELATGIVTSGELVGPFPAALYAHVANVSRKYFTEPPGDGTECGNILTDLYQGETGRKINFLSGRLDCGAQCRQEFAAKWRNVRLADDATHMIVTNEEELLNRIETGTDYFLRLYDDGTTDTLGQMTTGAVQMLQRQHGFLLVTIADPVAGTTLRQVNGAVESTLQLLRESLNDTLIVVTKSSKDQPLAEVYATGPMAHLFHQVQDQIYLPHLIALAARLGRFHDTDLENFLFRLF